MYIYTCIIHFDLDLLTMPAPLNVQSCIWFFFNHFNFQIWTQCIQKYTRYMGQHIKQLYDINV